MYDSDLASAYLRLISYQQIADYDAPDYIPKSSETEELKMKKLV